MVVVGGISLMEKLKIIGPSKDPCGIPFEKSPSPLTDCVPGRMERLTESNAFAGSLQNSSTVLAAISSKQMLEGEVGCLFDTRAIAI